MCEIPSISIVHAFLGNGFEDRNTNQRHSSNIQSALFGIFGTSGMHKSKIHFTEDFVEFIETDLHGEQKAGLIYIKIKVFQIEQNCKLTWT